MKYLLSCTLAVLLISQSSFIHLSYSQKVATHKLTGNITGLKNGTRIYLARNNKTMTDLDTIATTTAFNSNFSFKVSIPVEGEAFFVCIDSAINNERVGKITVILENADCHIEGLLSQLDFPHIKVKGSETHLEYLSYYTSYQKVTDSINQNLLDLQKNFKYDTTIDLYSRMNEASVIPLNEFNRQWVRSHPNSLVAPWVIMTNFYELADYEKQFRLLTARSKNSRYGIDLKRQIARMKKVAIGTIVPNFEVITSAGQKMEIYETINKNKITIVDFWASWCGPCRAQFPDMRELYFLYKNQGLNIIGVSVDESELKWKAALKKENLPWLNTWQGDTHIAKKLFDVTAIPYAIILDSKGKIIAKDLPFEELKSKIKELCLSNSVDSTN